MKKRRHLRELMMQDNKLIKVIGAHDGMSSYLAEINGFDAIWASGLGISAVNRVPDASILTMSEFLNAAVVMNESTKLPIIADCDSGYGNIHNVRRMIKKYESAGIAGICIEDKVFPKLNSFDGGKQVLVSIEEFSQKIAAAVDVRTDPNFLIIARIEALIAGLGIEEAYERAQAYEKAGADAILIHSKEKNSSEIEAFLNIYDLNLPIVVVPTKYPNITGKELTDLGVKFTIYANQTLRAAVTAMNETLASINENDSSANIEASICTVSDVFELQNVSEMKSIDEKFAGV